VEKEFLQYFAQNVCLSAYQILSLHNNSRYNHPMVYKNVHTRVIRLYELNLIENVEKESERGAKYYRLSTGGIYNLIRKQRRLFIKIIKNVLQNYEDNIIFKMLLYPYLEKNTILHIYDTRLLSKICGYLYDCCEATEIALDSINNIDGRYISEEVFIWKDVPGIYKARLLNFLKRRFNLNWVDNAKIIKFADGKTIKIEYRNNSLLIVLNDEKTSAELRINRKKVYEFVVNRLDDNWLPVCAPGDTIKETYTKFFEVIVNSLVPNLIFTLALEALPDVGVGFEVLAQDNKFMKLLEKIKGQFDERYQLLTEGKRKRL
jgi:hypothetical protein